MPNGTLYVISAPSGAGKTSLVKALLGRDPGLHLSVSYTTRAPRPGETDGVHYRFVAPERFKTMVAADAFLEHAEVFGNWYGTAEAAVRRRLDAGQDLILEIDWQGARQVRKRFPEAVGIFILPPSVVALEARLRGRGQDDEAVIAKRMALARDEMAHVADYEYLVVNDHFEVALDDLAAIVRTHRLRRSAQGARLGSLLAELLGESADNASA